MTPKRKQDLIVARATAAGPSAIAIIRADGPGAAELARKLFHPAGSRHPTDHPREAIFGAWIDAEESAGDAGPGALSGAPSDASIDTSIDSGLTLFMRGPHSYTGNDLVEFQCHGSAAVVRRLLAACVSLGARPAEPGEFTRRAFLNGRLDLAQAEAVGDLIRAETDAAAIAAQAQLAGGLSAKIHALRGQLIDLAAEIEARIDFPEDAIEAADLNRLNGIFGALQSGLDRLIAMKGRGKLLREGARVALVGEPNVGKSSLLNALARIERAIVTPHPGTTRDTVECTIDLRGIPVTIIDTAGLRESDDPVESIGIERSRRVLEEADVVVEVRDVTAARAGAGTDAGADDHPRWIENRQPDLIVENKIDLRKTGNGGIKSDSKIPRLGVSALTGSGLEAFEERLAERIGGDAATGGPGDAFLINERHAGLLTTARSSVEQAAEAWSAEEGSELVMIDLREGLNALDEILGLTPHEAIIDRIFEQFCLGK
jgi:tRNA modification GTPase